MLAKGSISYSSPSNIAIVKYWGKEPGDQIPMNASLSMTLDVCRSFTEITYEVGPGTAPAVEVWFEGERSTEIEAKMQRWFTKISFFFSWLKYARLRVESRNNFPHSAGIASSASGMSALAMCLAGIDRHLRNMGGDDLQVISNVARLGSGSASRSVMGPWVVWGQTDAFPEAANDFAMAVPGVHKCFQNLNDTIIVVDNKPKSISSREGHALMDGHLWRQGRIEQAGQNLNELKKALLFGDWKTFEKVTENEALSLHALMLASQGGMMLWKGETIEWIHYLRRKRQQLGTPMAFTLDAGANIHLVYPDSHKEEVLKLLHESPVYVNDLIHDKAGHGPEKLTDEYESF